MADRLINVRSSLSNFSLCFCLVSSLGGVLVVVLFLFLFFVFCLLVLPALAVFYCRRFFFT